MSTSARRRGSRTRATSASTNARALVLVAAGREQLFELVDGDDHAGPRCRRRRPRARARLLAGPQQGDRPALAAGQHAGRQRREQPGPQRRRLAAPGRPDDARQRRAGEPRDQLGDQPLTAEEDVGVLDVERRQALERADHDVGPAGLRAPPPRLQLDDRRPRGRPRPLAAPGARPRGGSRRRSTRRITRARFNSSDSS